MIAFIMKLVGIGEHTVATILSDFHSAVRRLEDLGRKHVDMVQAKAEQIEKLGTEIEQHSAEALKANAVAAQIKALLQPAAAVTPAKNG